MTPTFGWGLKHYLRLERHKTRRQATQVLTVQSKLTSYNILEFAVQMEDFQQIEKIEAGTYEFLQKEKSRLPDKWLLRRKFACSWRLKMRPFHGISRFPGKFLCSKNQNI